MPIYEYVCSACERRIEVVHSIHGSGPAACEVCGGAMRKALSAPAIHFKGSGWAKKDARAAAPAAPAAPEAKKDDAPASTGAEGATAPAATPSASEPPAATTPAAKAPAASGSAG